MGWPPAMSLYSGLLRDGARHYTWLVKPHFRFIFQRGMRLFGFAVLLGYDFRLVKRATVGLTLVYLGH